jgi:uncharacterized damage-inducible protein DinB
MAAKDVVSSALDRNWGMVDRAIEGIDDATLNRQPNDQSNSIAWLSWHMNRVVDVFINDRLQSKPQLWVQDGWHEKFGMSDDPGQTGQGMTSEQTSAWAAPSREVLLGYAEAVKTSAREYLASITDADLEGTVVVPPSNEPRPVSDLLGILVYDNVVHGGQIAYLRGYFAGMGWFV